MSSEVKPARHPVKTLLPYMRPYTRGIAAGLVLVVVANVFQVIAPILIQHAIDALETPPAHAWANLLKYAALIVAVALLMGLARYAMRELLNGISRRIENDIRVAFF